ncbi:MAG: discoidin domain-containing protein [Akkermansiaceae bacterium]|nr:discoidin domain-containing protein [Akkermansiaceae bacterium]
MKKIMWNGVVCFGVMQIGLQAAIVSNPTVTGSATAYNGSYAVGNLFDNSFNGEYATQGGGAGDAFSTNPSNGTWVEMNFGGTVSADRFALVTRKNTNDVIGESRLILSNDNVFDGTDTIITINPTGNNASGPETAFTQTTFQFARWEVTTSVGGSQNLGGTEMIFLTTPAGSQLISTVNVQGGYAAYNGNYALANAANGNYGYESIGHEYASAGAGNNMYVEFDLGELTKVTGFDLFQRGKSADQYTSFDLVFSDTSDFSNELERKSYTINGLSTDDMFAGIDAQYVRLEVTGGTATNTGIVEMNFYKAVPEVSSSTLFGLGVLTLLIRRWK